MKFYYSLSGKARNETKSEANRNLTNLFTFIEL